MSYLRYGEAYARNGRSGAPWLVRDMEEAGYRHDRKTFADSLRRQGLRARATEKFKASTNSRHNLPVAPDLLPKDFSVTGRNQKYVGDITYLWTEEGWLDLAVVIELYSSLVVGWAIGPVHFFAKGGLVLVWLVGSAALIALPIVLRRQCGASQSNWPNIRTRQSKSVEFPVLTMYRTTLQSWTKTGVDEVGPCETRAASKIDHGME